MVDLFTGLPDNAITAPGVYQISHAEYLDDPVITPSLSKSIAKLLIEKSPAHAWSAHPRFGKQLAGEDADDEPAASTPTRMAVGTAAHAIFLNGEDVVTLVDAENWKTNKAKAARAEIEAAGRIPLLKERYNAVHLVVSALQRFRDKTGAFTAGRPEQTLVWHEGQSWCRAKVDWLPDEPSAPLWDLKTVTGAATEEQWSRQAFDLGSDIQASFYCRGAESIFGEPPECMNFCVIETKAPFGIKVYNFGPAGIEIGDGKVSQALRTWEWCMADNRWPNYPIERQLIEPPVWVLRRWEHLTATGQALRERQHVIREADNLTARMLETGQWGA